MSMPCSTFCSGRTGYAGPEPLRGTSGVDVYGLPGLSLKDKEKARGGTILALRGASLAWECLAQDIPWLAETPQFKDGAPSLLRLQSGLKSMADGTPIENASCNACLACLPWSPRKSGAPRAFTTCRRNACIPKGPGRYRGWERRIRHPIRN